jgi:hypothetical protein
LVRNGRLDNRAVTNVGGIARYLVKDAATQNAIVLADTLPRNMRDVAS